MNSLPHSVLLRQVQLVQLHGMPEVLYPGKVRGLRPGEDNFACFRIFSHMAFIPSPDWKGWKELAKQDGLEGAAILGPAKRSWRCGYVFDVLPVDKKAIIAIVNVFFVDETSEKPDVGISLAWERPWRKAALRMRRLLDWQKRA